MNEKIALIVMDMCAILADFNDAGMNCETPEIRQMRYYEEKRDELPEFKSTDRK